MHEQVLILNTAYGRQNGCYAQRALIQIRKDLSQGWNLWRDVVMPRLHSILSTAGGRQARRGPPQIVPTTNGAAFLQWNEVRRGASGRIGSMLSSLRASTCAVPVKAGAYPRPNSVGTAGRRPSAVPTRSTPSRPLRLRAAAPEAPSTPARPKTPAELPPDLRNPVSATSSLPSTAFQPHRPSPPPNSLLHSRRVRIPLFHPLLPFSAIYPSLSPASPPLFVSPLPSPAIFLVPSILHLPFHTPHRHSSPHHLHAPPPNSAIPSESAANALEGPFGDPSCPTSCFPRSSSSGHPILQPPAEQQTSMSLASPMLQSLTASG